MILTLITYLKLELLWSLMTKGERNKDKSDRRREITKGGDQLKFEAHK
jgi:hypothetical protein